MRTIKIIAATVLAAVVVASCGTSKNVSKQYGKKVQLTQSQEMANESPSTRAWGEGTSYSLSEATAYAEGQARAKMARALSSAITTATEESNLGWEQYASNGAKGAIAIDESGKRTSSTMQIAQESISGAVTIHTDQFVQDNGQYRVFVCLEYRGDVGAKASDITNKVRQQVPDEQRAKMEEQFQQFEEKVQKELERMNTEAE